MNLDNAISMSPKIVLFSLFLNTKLCFAMIIKITIPNDLYHQKDMTETVVLSLVMRCQHIKVLWLEFVQQSGHPVRPISERSLKSGCISPPKYLFGRYIYLKRQFALNNHKIFMKTNSNNTFMTKLLRIFFGKKTLSVLTHSFVLP